MEHEHGMEGRILAAYKWERRPSGSYPGGGERARGAAGPARPRSAGERGRLGRALGRGRLRGQRGRCAQCLVMSLQVSER